jgi:hypothetical protein
LAKERRMTGSTVLGIIALLALVAFVVSAFRQGMKVKPNRDGAPADSTMILPPDGSTGGHWT